mmetsp:Transcript_13019/g.26400  ORF Transcript_13019/g.26400 Transcript_13019/m.26400 type:complete len:230 (+) Transcript_13019:171-860(+)
MPHPDTLRVVHELGHDLVAHAVLPSDEHEVHTVVGGDGVARVAILEECVLVVRAHVQVWRRQLERRLVQRCTVTREEVAVAAVLGDAELGRALLAHRIMLPVVVDEAARAQLAVDRHAVDEVRLDRGGHEFERGGGCVGAPYRDVIGQVRTAVAGGRRSRQATAVIVVGDVGDAASGMLARLAGVVGRQAELVFEVGGVDRDRVHAVHRVVGKYLRASVGRQLAILVDE